MATKAELLKKIHPQSIYHALNTALQDDSAILADFKALTFLGRNGAGAITLTGAASRAEGRRCGRPDSRVTGQPGIPVRGHHHRRQPAPAVQRH